MDFKNKIDFCVISNPYSGLKDLIFVTYHGANQIDEKLCEEEDYELIKYLLNGHGFKEIDYCTFESSNLIVIPTKDLIYQLTEFGLKYSKSLEFNIMAEISSFNKEFISHSEMSLFNKNIVPDSNVYFSTTNPNLQNNLKTKIPEIGEKIILYFYLFLQCHFVNESDCVLELIGDLYTKEDSNTRNYLQITNSEFIRLESNIPNVLLFQSVKTYKNFSDEINFLHKGKFRFVKPLMNPDGDMVTKVKEFVYNIMEIKKNINPVHRIIVEVNVNQYYDDMLKMSKKIKRKSTSECKKIISVEVLKPEIIHLKQKLSNKMLSLAETEEFERANLVKKDINFIDNKIKIIDSLEEKNITQKEYLKTFCLNS